MRAESTTCAVDRAAWSQRRSTRPIPLIRRRFGAACRPGSRRTRPRALEPPAGLRLFRGDAHELGCACFRGVQAAE
eukprot:8462184-Alexandrium_andersonii.AAC.1